jgi:hypothetical protein
MRPQRRPSRLGAARSYGAHPAGDRLKLPPITPPIPTGPETQDRPVRPEVAGSSRVAPALYVPSVAELKYGRSASRALTETVRSSPTVTCSMIRRPPVGAP